MQIDAFALCRTFNSSHRAGDYSVKNSWILSVLLSDKVRQPFSEPRSVIDHRYEYAVDFKSGVNMPSYSVDSAQQLFKTFGRKNLVL